MDYREFASDVARQEAARFQTHYIEDTGGRARVYRAICGTSVHSGDMHRLSSGEPTCPVCQTKLAEFDGDESEF